MSLSPRTPTRNRALTRQLSSPSLSTVGLPPPIPESPHLPSPSATKSSRKQPHTPRIHRGDVSSSATSSCSGDSDDGSIDSKSVPTTPVKHASAHSHPGETTPKRKTISSLNTMSVGRPQTGAKRVTLQDRLNAVAKVRPSKSMEGLNVDVPQLPHLPASPSKLKVSSGISSSARPGSPEKARSGAKNDKVIVCVRVKPTRSPFAETAYEITPSSLTLSDSHPNVLKRGGKAGREDEYTYTFDHLLQHPSTTPELYEAKVAPLVKKAMNGFNSTIFAYGQTGSGKSFTMSGVPSQLGIIPCAVDGVFDAINEEVDRAYLLRVSYLEIYNETLRDLLTDKKGPLKPQDQPVIHTGNGKVYVEPLVEKVVSTPQDVVDLLAHGNNMRRIGATDWNEQSSRSHSVFTIVIESRPRDGGEEDDIRLSRLNLIDLAGSEKAVSDLERRSEGKHINKSLLALREVINKLTEKNRTHVPYRNSKLTHLLENALGGDSNICVICTLSAEEANCAETLETLKFAGRCSQVETQAKKNVLLSNDKALIRAKDREIQDLRRRLDGLQHSSSESVLAQESSEHISQLADSVSAMEERKARLQEQLSKLNGEILTSEVLPRSMSGLPMSPKIKRRRISDISSVGMGTPKKGMGDRRVVSNIMRVAEEAEMPAIATLIEVTESTSTFGDDVVASLRRRLTAKEDELSLVNQQLSEALGRIAQLAAKEAEVTALREELDRITSERLALIDERTAANARFESELRDARMQLESTRSELVKTIGDKTASIDKLEETILDLRKSREDLAIEDQDRYDEVKRELDSKSEEARVAKEDREAAEKLLTEMKEAHAEAITAIGQEKLDAADSVERLKRELEDLGQQHDETTRRAECMSGRSQALEGELADCKLRLDTAMIEYATLETSRTCLAEERDAMERSRQEARDDLDRFQKAAMSSESTAVAALKAELAAMREARDQERAASSNRTAEMQAAIDAEKAKTEELERQVERAQTTSADLEAGLATARAAQNDVSAREQDLLRQLDQERSEAKAQLDDGRSTIAALSKEVDAQKHALAEAAQREEAFVSSQAKTDVTGEAVAKEVERLNTELQSAAERERIQAETTETRVADLSAQLREAEGREAQLRAATDEGDSQTLALRDELALLKAALERAKGEAQQRVEAAQIESVSHRARAAQAEEATTRLSEQHQSTVTSEQEIRQQVIALKAASEEAIATERIRADEAVQALDTGRARITELEKREVALLEAKAHIVTRERDLAQQLDRLREEVLDGDTQLSETIKALEAERAARRAAEAAVEEAKSDLAGRITSMSQLNVDNAEMRQALTNAQNELEVAEKKAHTSSENATALAKQLAEVKMALPASTSAASVRARHAISASDPTRPSNDVIFSLRANALTDASTGHDSNSPATRLMTAERDEIDRLEKIVEAQKVIIDEQKERIKFWARELEQQREIVRALTINPDSSPRNRASPRGHSKTKSVPNVESPLVGQLGTTPKKPFPSTFTAFNLALPTTPTPLPMHASQFDNASGKKGRRVTIEHDIDVLMDSSKVNKARAMFDSPKDFPSSPSKTPVNHKRAGSAVMGSVPKQRRP